MLTVGLILGGRYKILAPIGAGGMGEVYRASDQRLQRDVALKVLPERVRSDPDALSRFEREGKTLAALSHPNIVAIHDFGTDQGIYYAVTELLHGQSLRSVLERSGIPWRKAVELAIPIANGLSAAHGAGIIHRDLKPENVFLTSDHRIKILDFGLARRDLHSSVDSVTSAPTASRQTAPNVILGTVPYMSPEQIKGDPLDARTDIFSFGCLLYEMISGRRPFHGETAPELMTAILKQDPPPLSDVPPELQQDIAHCLEKQPDDRFQSARDLEFALKTVLTSSGRSEVIAPPSRFPWLTIGIACVVLMVAIAAWFVRTKAQPSASLRKSIAVLPFSNLTGNKEEEYFSDGMTEDVITQLSKVADLKVISRTSVMPYKNTNKSLREIGKELDVGVVLEGSVRRSGNRLRIVGQLIDAATDEHIWADTYDRDLKDVFAIQSEVAQDIAEALRTKLSPIEKQRIEKRPTENLEAYDLYLKGREHLYHLTKKDNEQAIELLKSAINLDSSFALAYATLADAYSIATISGAPESLYDTAIETSQKAISLDPELAEGYEALGYAYQFKGWYGKAIEMEKKALELNPNYARATGVLGKTYWLTGRLEESLSLVKKYRQLDPTSPLPSRYVGDVYRMLDDPSEAKKWYQHCLGLDPTNRECYANLILIAYLYGTYAEVKPLQKQILAVARDEPGTFWALRDAELFFSHYQQAMEYDDRLTPDWKDDASFYLSVKTGRRAEAEKLFASLERDYQKRKSQNNEAWTSPLRNGALHAIKGDKQTAYQRLSEAVQQGFIQFRILERTPVYENLRNDAEFQEIIFNLKARVEEMRKRLSEQNQL